MYKYDILQLYIRYWNITIISNHMKILWFFIGGFKILNEFFCNLLLNMFTIFPNTLYYVVFYSLLNAYEFSKVCIFVFCFENCQSKFQIILQNNMLTTLWLIFLNFKLQCYFICLLNYTLSTCVKGFLKFWNFEAYFEFLNFKLHNIFLIVNF